MNSPHEQSRMRAITLHRPWPGAMAYLGKSFENRTWASWLTPGEWVAIHAGKKFDKEGAQWIKRVFGSEGTEAFLCSDNHPTGVILLARFKQNVEASDSLWFTGPVAWEFDQRILLDEPVDCSGKQGIWQLSTAQRASVLAQCQSEKAEAFLPAEMKGITEVV